MVEIVLVLFVTALGGLVGFMLGWLKCEDAQMDHYRDHWFVCKDCGRDVLTEQPCHSKGA